MTNEPSPGQKWDISELVKSTDTLMTLVGTFAADSNTPASSKISAHIYNLAAGQPDEQSPHDQDEFYYVVSGSRTLLLGDKIEVKVKPGDLVWVPAGEKHAFAGEETLALLVFFAPNFTGPPNFEGT